MAIRMVMRKVLNRGIDAGIDAVARRGKPRAELTASELAQAKASKGKARDMQKMMRMGRRLTRM